MEEKDLTDIWYKLDEINRNLEKLNKSVSTAKVSGRDLVKQVKRMKEKFDWE